MAYFQKKPIVVEAFQNTEEYEHENEIPSWWMDAITSFVAYPKEGSLYIKTLEGDMLVNHGDWVIRGVAGEIYPCKPQIFEATYTKVDTHVAS